MYSKDCFRIVQIFFSTKNFASKGSSEKNSWRNPFQKNFLTNGKIDNSTDYTFNIR